MEDHLALAKQYREKGGEEADEDREMAAKAESSALNAHKEHGRVEYRLTVRMARIASWFASEAKLRQKQEALVASYLDALAAAFAPEERRL